MIAALRKLVLGETWILPLGVAVTLLAGLALDAAGPGWWHRAGGFFLLACVLAALVLSLHSAGGLTPARRSAASSGGRRGPSRLRRRPR